MTISELLDAILAPANTASLRQKINNVFRPTSSLLANATIELSLGEKI